MTLGMRREKEIPEPVCTETPLADLPFNLDSEVYEAKLKELGSISDQSPDTSYRAPPQTPDSNYKESTLSDFTQDGGQEDVSETSVETILSPISAKRRIQIKLPLMLEEDDEEGWINF